MEKIGLRIKRVRKMLNKSQSDLAHELNITKQAISNMETSKSYPNIALLNRLSTEYNVNLNYIICGMGEIFIPNEKSNKNLRKALLNEVEKFLDARGIS